GGRVLWSGPLTGLAVVEESVTAQYLHRPVHPEEIRRSAPRPGTGVLTLTGLSRHTVRGVDVDLPLGALTVVTGISGSGKTSLLDAVHDVVGAELARVEDEPELEDEVDATDEGVVPAGPGRDGTPGDGGDPTPTARATARGDGIPR